MSRTPVISLRAVKKSYGVFALGPINLEVEPGCVVAIVGPNGGGKSTLMGMLMNLVQPTSGEISIFGGRYPEDELAIKQKIGYAPERLPGCDDLSVKSLRVLVSHFYPGWDQRLYEDTLADVALGSHDLFGELSTGTQRRIGVALALATGSELLLLDEPTAGLDPLARDRVLGDISRFMADERHGDRTVVFTTHLIKEVTQIADYVALLVDGKLGFYEKDALLEGWKVFWLDKEPERGVPGTIELEGGDPARIVSDSPRETAEALRAQNVRIVHSRTLDLEEILTRLMNRRDEGRLTSPHAG
jgi:ABC-2 type transport system ATP-binding protein